MRGSPERRRRGLRERRKAPRRAGMTTSVPIYPPVFARHDAKVTLRNIPTGYSPGKPTSDHGDSETPTETADRRENTERLVAGSMVKSTRSKLTPAPIPTF